MIDSPQNTNGWNEYSRLVLKELETLSQGIVNLNVEIQEVKREIALIKDREDKVEDLKVWKEKLDDVISPSQLRELVKEVQELRAFKTKSITIFVVIQFLILVLNMFKDKIF
jgi:predicted  nucleic acid-binding Zn-ribbon protein